MKLLRIFIVMMLFAVSCSFGAAGVYADENISEKSLEATDVNVPFDSGSDLDVFGSVSYKKALCIEGEEYNLYPVFNDQTSALRNAENECSDLLAYLKSNYDLGAFGKNTVYAYYDRSFDLLDEIDTLKEDGDLTEAEYETLNNELDTLSLFMDIYENEKSNDEIIDEVNKIDFTQPAEGTQVTENVYSKIENALSGISELELMLPDNTGAVEAITDYRDEQMKLLSENDSVTLTPQIAELMAETSDVGAEKYGENGKFSVAKGVEYAAKWAKSYNKSEYGRCSGGDCTNFTSQIKHEGGVPLFNGTSKPYRAPWKYYKYGKGKINWSDRWANADRFGKFFGEKSKYKGGSYTEPKRYKAFVNFSKAVKKGSFIGYCKTSDGDWDHMGFVTEVTNNYKSYHGYKYRDFRVAQHSDPYNALVSSKTNGWENIVHNHEKAIYVIIY